MRWRCRRGMREMDLLLESFLDRFHATLDQSQRQAFMDLLNEADQDIMAWIMRLRQPPREDYRWLIDNLSRQRWSIGGSRARI